MRAISNSTLACCLAAFLVTGIFAVRNFATWPARLAYDGDESYEGVALAETIHLRQGIPIYSATATEGYDAATYGPFYYMLAGRLINPDRPSYFPLRLLSVLGVIGCAGCCGILAFWLTRNFLAVYLSPLVFLSYGMVTGHGIQALSDSVALFLAFLGFLVAHRFRSSRAILLAVPFLILSFYYKPQYVAGSLAIFFFLVLEKRFQHAAEFAGLLAFAILGLFGLFEWVIFPGQSFWHHFVLSQTSLLTWHRFGQALFALAVLLLFPLLFCLEYLRAHSDRLISCYLFFGVLLGVLTYSKNGSGVHYFFESVLIFSTLVPVLLVKQASVRGSPVYIVLVLGVMVFAGQWSTKPAPQPSDFARHAALESYLQQDFPRHARALGASPGELLQAGLETPYSGLFQLAQLAHRGVVSDRELAERIRGRQFAVIVLNLDLRQERDPFWLYYNLTPATLNAIEHSYVLAASLDMPAPQRLREQDRYYLYVPRVD